MTDAELAEMVKICSSVDEDLDILMDPSDIIWMANEIRRLREFKRERDAEKIGWRSAV